MRKYKIKEIAQEISIRIDDPKHSGYEKFVGLEHYDSGKVMISRYGDATKLDSSVKLFKQGDILIARRNVYLKRASMVDFDGVTSGDSIVIRANDSSFKRLLPFVFNTDAFWNYAIQYSDGSMSKRLSPQKLLEYEVNLPENESERNKLSETLWNMYETMSSYEKVIQSSDELVKSQFMEMFGTMDLSEQRSEWTELEKLARIYTGTTPSSTDDSNWNGDILWITPAEMTNDSFYIYDTVRKLTEKGRKSKALEIMPINTVLLSTRAPIGKVGIVGTPMACNQGFKNFACGEKLNHVFLYTILKANTEYLNSIGSGTTFLELPKAKVGKIKIPVPSIELQNDFETFVLKIDKSKLMELEEEKLYA